MNQEQAYSKIETHFKANREKFTKRFSRYFSSKERGEDVVSEAYTRMLTYWSTAPEDDTEFEKWTRTVVNNCGKNNHKEEMLHGATNHPEVEAEEIVQQAVPSIILKRVMSLIETKDKPIQIVLKLALIEGWKAKQIMEVVEYNKRAVEDIIYKFRVEVRDLYRVAI